MSPSVAGTRSIEGCGTRSKTRVKLPGGRAAFLQSGGAPVPPGLCAVLRLSATRHSGDQVSGRERGPDTPHDKRAELYSLEHLSVDASISHIPRILLSPLPQYRLSPRTNRKGQ